MVLETLASVDTRHEDMIHDAQMDFFGKRLATASSDRTVRIFDVVGDKHTFVAELKGHEGPVWQVAWAHPKFGNLLASCSYDRKVIIWRETNGQWQKIHEHVGHTSSVNAVAWAPPEYASSLGDDHGLMLACASSDGFFSVVTSKDGGWESKKYMAHSNGCNAISWAPAFNPASLLKDDAGGDAAPATVKRLVTGGCDNAVKVWEFSDDWRETATLKGDGHTDWVRDVAWAPNIGLPTNVIASCGQDRNVIIWKQDLQSGAQGWTSRLLNQFQDVVWRVSWSVTGNILAVSGGDNKVTLWKEQLDGKEKKPQNAGEKDDEESKWVLIGGVDEANGSH